MVNDASEKAAKTAENRNYITALARGLSVMKAFTQQNEHMTLAEVARIVDLPRAAVRRSLLTLEALGYVESTGRYFRLSPQVLTIAQAYLSSSTLPRVAQPFIETVSETLGESCSVSILHGAQVIYIARSTRKRMASLHRDVGSHLPAHCTSMGRVLLANLPPAELDGLLARTALHGFTPYTVTDKDELKALLAQVRRDGFCLVDQELEIDLRSLAVPVHNAAGHVVAAMNISTGAGRTGKALMLETYLPVLRQAAAGIRPLLLG